MEEIQLVDRVLALLRQEWQAGASGSPGFHHQQQAMSRAQVAAALDIEFAPDTGARPRSATSVGRLSP